ncbi:MAG: toll/interleukin-1 receptor domain-containing protein [Candidatus Dormibacteria bacterium]
MSELRLEKGELCAQPEREYLNTAMANCYRCGGQTRALVLVDKEGPNPPEIECRRCGAQFCRTPLGWTFVRISPEIALRKQTASRQTSHHNVYTRADLPPEQLAVLDRLVKAWTESPSADWPIFQWLERDVEINCGLDLELVLKAFPSDLAPFDHYSPDQAEGIIALTVPGLACGDIETTEEHLNLFMNGLRWLLANYGAAMTAVTPGKAVTAQASSELMRSDSSIGRNDGVALSIARLGQLFRREPCIWTQFGGPNSPSNDDWTLTIDRRIRDYRGVVTLDDYLGVRASKVGRWVGRTVPKAQPAEDASTNEAAVSNPPVETSTTTKDLPYDIFLSHASEDKAAFVDALVAALENSGLTVWYSPFELHLGDSLTESINHGLRSARYGLVVLSRSFFAKQWTQAELGALFALMMQERAKVLPVWHGLSSGDIAQYAPLLANRLAARSDEGATNLAARVLARIDRDIRVSAEPSTK